MGRYPESQQYVPCRNPVFEIQHLRSDELARNSLSLSISFVDQATLTRNLLPQDLRKDSPLFLLLCKSSLLYSDADIPYLLRFSPHSGNRIANSIPLGD
jgi:hypothetical protein